MLRAKVKLTRSVAIALMPDNTDNVITEVEGDDVTTYFDTTKIGTLIATVDDYLMNARVAWDMIKLVSEGKNKGKG